MITENELDNHLVRQKDELLKLIQRRRFDEATAILHFVKPMWEACNYGYKWDEVKQRLLKK